VLYFRNISHRDIASSLFKLRSHRPSPDPPADGIYPFHLEIRALVLHSIDYKYTAALKEPREKHGFVRCYESTLFKPGSESGH